MAGTAPEVGRQMGELMGFPCENDTEDQTDQINHMDSACDLNGDQLGVHVSQDGESEPQASNCNLSEKSMRSDSDIIKSSLEASQEMSEGQAADNSQLPSDDNQEALPTASKKCKRGRPRKRLAYNRKVSKKISTSDAEQKKTEPRRSKAPAKLKQKCVTDSLLQTPLQHDGPATPETPEMTPGGRPKRRAAKVALEYLQKIHQDLDNAEKASTMREDASPVELARAAGRGRGRGRGQKRKSPDCDSDYNDDADFNPEAHAEVESEEDDFEDYQDSKPCLQPNKKTYNKVGSNGFSHTAMQPVWASFRITKEFRDEHCSPWVFSEWMPSITDWHLLSISEAEKYLPEEEESMAFMLSRDGIKDQRVLQRVKRFESSPPHAERWDSLFFVGGPVWAMEWCPCPDGAAEKQYAALYCNTGMDDRHKVNALHTGRALLQLWDLGNLQMSRPSSSPRLAYALAETDGCIWNLKWCPSGAWELHTTSRKTPHMPRLGLIAAAFSNGSIAIYSLPHPEALMTQHPVTGKASQAPLIYRVKRIMTLKVGSSQADHHGRCGQSFALDWLPVKPHNVLAAGFYDGMVALWDLGTKSPLQRVRAPDRSICLYPYHCFPAHDNNIRSLSWCKASSELLVTVGDDRKVNFWDLSKTHTPLKAMKRFLPTEVSWPLLWSGVFLAQECCYTSLGQQGLHYLDSGYFGQKPFFVCTRKATVWSLSVSDWLNSSVIGDNIGDLVCSLLCDPNRNYGNAKRHRFPVYSTEMVPFERAQGQGLAGGQTDQPTGPQLEPQSYRGAVRKYYLHFNDMDLRSFSKYQDKPIVKKLHASETKGILFVDQVPLNALYKVRFNPNMVAHGWVLSAGQSGLVRVHCVRGLSGAVMHKLVQESQAHFSAMFHSQETSEDTEAVRHCTADTVQV
ncbi:general transcription factor 3C polypeptide 2 [Brachyhypopomus gauderio]|uniref:general transcription factor 3C polypeptide 2 n=1 Tax=Brachyhypopomus gauderio TaxID=698409 RepID=UPI0040426A82